VPAYSVARLAVSDLKSILRYTMKNWGRAQTVRYKQGLQNCFQFLAENRSLGRSCDSIHPGLRRFEIGKHVVFYIPEPGGVLIVRVLHQQMIPASFHFEQ
jgi:toxin ParE1/3/4